MVSSSSPVTRRQARPHNNRARAVLLGCSSSPSRRTTPRRRGDVGPARVALLPPHAAPRPLWPEGSQRCSVKNRMQANNELVRHRSAGPSCRSAPRGYVVLLEDPAWPLTARCSRRAPSPRKRSTTASPRWWRCAGCCSLDAAPGNAQVPRALQQNVVQGPTGLPRRGPRRRPAGPGVRKRQVLVHPLSLGSFSILLRHRPCVADS